MSSSGEVADSHLLRKYKEGAALVRGAKGWQWLGRLEGVGGFSLYCTVPAEGTTFPRRHAARELRRAEQHFHTPAADAAVARPLARPPLVSSGLRGLQTGRVDGRRSSRLGS